MSQDSFGQKKASILSEIGETLSSVPDASPKGSIDELCLPIMRLINSHNDMVTTSSCSGRVSVFVEGSKQNKIGGKGEGGYWMFVTHDKNELSNWFKGKFTYASSSEVGSAASQLSTRFILFKYEPFILHVKCRNYETAANLYTAAMSCGFRESGIGINNIVAIRISIRLDVPIGYLDESGAPGEHKLVCFVDESYLEIITKLSVDRFNENEKRMGALFKAIEAMEVKPAVQKETFEQRRERKRREGLERQRLKSEAQAAGAGQQDAQGDTT